MKRAVCLLLLVAPCLVIAQKKVIVNKTIHLRDGMRQEWSTFPVNAKDSILTFIFNADAFKANAVISLIQTDVSHPWTVELNGTRLGNLVIDENRMITYFQVPAGVLVENANTLIIRPEKGNQP